MASPQRVARMREEVIKDTSDILRKMKDPRLGFVTVTGAEVTTDMRYVKIFVSVLGEEDAVERSMEALASGAGFVRSEIGKRIRLRHTPEITFRLDRSVQQGARIDQLLADIRRDEESKNAGDDN